VTRFSPDGNATRARVVAFDVDGTLTTGDCVVPFLRRVAGTPRLLARLASHPIGVSRAVARRDRDTLKSLAAHAAFSGRSVSRVSAEASHFAAAVAAERLRADTVQALQAHQQAGDTVVLVSASFEIYLHPLGGLLGVDGVLGARLAADDGVLTGALDGPNCRGPEKVRRLHDWLGLHVGGRDAIELIAYGDSAGDRELLADADTAHWVGSYRP
jgi:phosphatidylglycerophosphatase C